MAMAMPALTLEALLRVIMASKATTMLKEKKRNQR